MAKYTNGNEFALLDGTPYKGIYCMKSKGNYYTGKTYVYGVSKKIIPIIDDESITPKMIRNYNELETLYSQQEFVSLKSYFPNPTDKDYDEKKVIKRYFGKKANKKNSKIVEIDKKQFSKKYSYYKYLSLDWKIARNDYEDENSIIEFNRKQIDMAKETMPNIELKLINLKELSIRKKSDLS